MSSSWPSSSARRTKYPFAASYPSGSVELKSRRLLYLFGLWALTGLPALTELQVFRYGRWSLRLPFGLMLVAVILAAWRVLQYT